MRVFALTLCAALTVVPLTSAQTSTPANKAAAPKSSAAAPKTAAKAAAPAKTLSKPVVTISGVCPVTATAAKAKAFSPSCQTVITEGDMEKLIDALNPDMPVSVRRNLGGSLGDWTAFAAKAHEQGLDSTPDFKEMMKFARTQLLYQVLDRNLRKQAENIPPAEVQAYFDGHKSQFEEFNLIRVIVPRQQASKDKPVDEAAEKQYAQDIRDRLAKGEDAKALQTEAFKHAGQNSPEPPVEVNNRRRGTLPASQEKIFDLKPGETSEVLTDPAAFFIYKVVSRTAPTVDKVAPDVKKVLAGERYRKEMEDLHSQFKVNLDEAYFGPGPQQPPPGAPSMNPPGTQGRPSAPPPASAPSAPKATAPQPPTGTVPK